MANSIAAARERSEPVRSANRTASDSGAFNPPPSLRFDDPTRACVFDDFLPAAANSRIREDFRARLSKGLSQEPGSELFYRSRSRANATSERYSAYVHTIGPSLPAPYAEFAGEAFWKRMQGLFSLKLTRDLFMVLHHHPPQAPEAYVHADFEQVNFQSNAEERFVNLGGNFPYQAAPIRDAKHYQVTRSIALIYFLDDDEWQEGDGGETRFHDPRTRQVIGKVEPRNNRLLAFEITPRSMHSFAGRNRRVRNSVAMWLHSSTAEMFNRFSLLPSRADYADLKPEALEAPASHGTAAAGLERHFKDQAARLRAMRDLLRKWKVPAHVELAGICHGVTELASLPEAELAALKRILSSRAAWLVDLLSRIDLRQLWAASRAKPKDRELRDARGGEMLKLTYQDVAELMLVSAARIVERRPRTGNRDAYKTEILASREWLGPAYGSVLSDHYKLDARIGTVRSSRPIKKVVLTGASSGLGRALLNRLLESGTECWVLGRNAVLAEGARPGVHFLECDLADAVAIDRLDFAGLDALDALVNCAGVCTEIGKLAANVGAGDWERTLQVNLRAPALLMRKLSGALDASPWPLVVNISSYSGNRRFARTPGLWAYKASKAGLDALSQAAAIDHPRWTVLSLVPPPFKSRMGAPGAPDAAEAIAADFLALFERAYWRHSGGRFDRAGRRIGEA